MFLPHKIRRKFNLKAEFQNGLLEVSLHLESSEYVPCLDALIDFMYTGVLETANCKPLIVSKLLLVHAFIKPSSNPTICLSGCIWDANVSLKNYSSKKCVVCISNFKMQFSYFRHVFVNEDKLWMTYSQCI